MESTELVITANEVVRVDPSNIRKNAENSFNWFKKNGVDELPDNPIFWLSRIDELGNVSNEYSSTFKKVANIIPNLINIPEIYSPLSIFNEKEWNSIDKSNFKEASRNLRKLGIKTEKKILLEKIDKDCSVLEAIQKVQEEYLLITYASRVFEITKNIIMKHSPKVPLPQKDVVCYFVSKGSVIDLYGKSRPIADNNIHLLVFGGLLPGNIDQTLEIINNDVAKSDEFYGDTIATAIHEVGHSCFDELSNASQIDRSIGNGKAMHDTLTRALTEGYAILYEKLGLEILDKMVPGLPNNMKYGPNLHFIRNDHLYRYGKQEGAAYLDGYKVMRKLIWDLGIYNLSKEEQIVKISEFLGKVDILKTVDYKRGSAEYEKCVSNPVKELPIN